MAKKNRRSSARPSALGPRRSRLAAITLGAGVAIVLVFALVFSIAFGTQSIAGHAQALHNADEALRAATIVRSQVGLATHLSVLEREFGFDSGDSVALSLGETRLALDDLDESLLGLVEVVDLDASIPSSARQYNAVVIEILTALENGDTVQAQELSGVELDQSFRSFVGTLVVERDRQANEVATANAMMGRVGDLARFLVAFLVPTSAIIVYRELSRRQQRQKELEVRLETEKELGKARDDFVANASHELRTPLTSILGMSHLLEEDAEVAANPMAMEMVGMIISEANDLSRMVDDLLTTARLDAGALHYQFENLDAVVEIREVVGPMERSGARIGVFTEPAAVRSDRLRLRQVVRNLLSNARKYGGPNVRVIGQMVSGWYEIRVEDDGDGIPDELRNRLFQRYLHQGDMPLVLGSVGLGLSIVRALTEGMGGAVWYERRDGWTSFVIRVPISVDAEVSQYREWGSTSRGSRVTPVPAAPVAWSPPSEPVEVPVASVVAPPGPPLSASGGWSDIPFQPVSSP
jgi:signal transduction histidine kinase